MNLINWKKIVLVILVIFLFLQCKPIIKLIKEQSYDLIDDFFDYIWSIPQGMRFTLISTFCVMLLVLSFRVLMKRKGGSDRGTK